MPKNRSFAFMEALFLVYSLDLLNPAFPHRAFYDEDGNIILPSFGRASDPEETPVQRQEARISEPVVENIVEWIVVDDDPEALHKLEKEEIAAPTSRREPMRLHVRERIVALRTMTRSAMREGGEQYRVTVDAGRPLIRDVVDDVTWFFRTIWNFLAQPVWVPTRKREIKQYSRGTLFVLDILRFGGTFTVIFLVLFIALNYDSFWQITESKVTTILSSPAIDAPETAEENTIIETLKANASQTQDGRDRGELLSFLPTVGPPDNRILIPKLSLNVPLVTPPVASLLRQDWNQVETDIQNSLINGVVHYPGTAKPGQAGNFFITGHSSYYPWAPGRYKTVFARLQDLKPGDEYWVYYKGDRHRYIVTDKKEVSPSDVTVLDQPENKRISTLMTCTPVGTTLRRLVVRAQEVDPLSRQPLNVGQQAEKSNAPKLKLEALPI